MNKQFISEQTLLEDSYRLGVKIFEAGFKPDFIVGIWRGGSTVGIYVQECFQFLGVETDHIAIRTSYQGRENYLQNLESNAAVRAHGLQYLFETLEATHSLLIVDDVYSTGRNVDAVLERLKFRTKRNMPKDVRIAAPWYRPLQNNQHKSPDFFLHQSDDWLVLPYELTGVSREEMQRNKGWMLPILDELKPGWS